MNAKQALKEAVRRWGKNGAVRDYGKARASTPERRQAAHDEYLRIRERDGDLSKYRGTPEYKAKREERDNLLFESGHYRYMVGHVVMGLFFHVSGQGDTWEEAFAKADAQFPTKVAA